MGKFECWFVRLALAVVLLVELWQLSGRASRSQAVVSTVDYDAEFSEVESAIAIVDQRVKSLENGSGRSIGWLTLGGKNTREGSVGGMITFVDRDGKVGGSIGCITRPGSPPNLAIFGPTEGSPPVLIIEDGMSTITANSVYGARVQSPNFTEVDFSVP